MCKMDIQEYYSTPLLLKQVPCSQKSIGRQGQAWLKQLNKMSLSDQVTNTIAASIRNLVDHS